MEREHQRGRTSAALDSWRSMPSSRETRLPRTVDAASIIPAVRLFLVLMLVHGLAPGFAEVGEAVVHYARTGHIAHTDADRGDLGDQGSEHGCGTTQHYCACCGTQVVVSAGEAVVVSLDAGTSQPVDPPELKLVTRDPARPFRPPIS